MAETLPPQSREAMLQAFAIQVPWCEELGSPLTAAVLKAAAADYAAGGPVARVLAGWTQDPMGSAVTLRLAGGLHVLVLDGAAPGLAHYYPGDEGTPDGLDLAASVSKTVHEHHDFLRTFLEQPVQTNEIGRSACLLGGFLEISRRTGLPLVLLEIGASAGLNLMWDRYGYDLSGLPWGDPDSPVQLRPNWQGGPPALAERPKITSRKGCDIAPVDVTDAAAVRRAMSYIWPDQTERLTRFRGGVALARDAGVRVEKARAEDWLARHLHPRPGQCTVLVHSIMWQYMPLDEQKAILARIDAAGAAATDQAPLAWLRMEPPTPLDPPEVRLSLWPGGTAERLARCHPHGKDLHWHPEPLD